MTDLPVGLGAALQHGLLTRRRFLGLSTAAGRLIEELRDASTGGPVFFGITGGTGLATGLQYAH